jgi:hypothetical protein
MTARSRPIAVTPRPTRGIPFTPEPMPDPDSTHLGRLEAAYSKSCAYADMLETRDLYDPENIERAKRAYDQTRRAVMLNRGK